MGADFQEQLHTVHFSISEEDKLLGRSFAICRWFSVSSGSKYSDYFGILHTVHFILGENGVGLFLSNAENTLAFRVDVLEAELISMKKVLLFS